jgi:hypothetical protein
MMATKTLPSLFQCASVLLAVRWRLQHIGFAGAWEYVARERDRLTEGASDAHFAERTVHRLAQVAAVMPGRMRCLEQSMSLVVLLAKRGVPSELRLGFQPFGSAAHAWVECDGVPINEPLEILRRVVPFPSLPTV